MSKEDKIQASEMADERDVYRVKDAELSALMDQLGAAIGLNVMKDTSDADIAAGEAAEILRALREKVVTLEFMLAEAQGIKPAPLTKAD